MSTPSTTEPTARMILETRTLPSGREVVLKMPDLYRMLATTRGVPNPALASVLKLLAGEGNVEAANELERLKSMQAQIRGLYEIARLCLVSPKLRLDLAEGEEPDEGEIGPEELPLADAEVIYFGFFRLGPVRRAGTRDADAGAAPNDRPAGAALPVSAEPAPGD